MININKKILIVDDDEINRMILSEMLKDEYGLLEASDGIQALDIIETQGEDIALVLLDVVMPKLDGFGVLEALNKSRKIEDYKVIMISSEGDPEIIAKAYDLGASDYISRPFYPQLVHKRITNAMLMYLKEASLLSMVKEETIRRERDNRIMISILSHIVEFRNGESAKHVININIITEFLLKELIKRNDKYKELEKDISVITLASSLHDVGKIEIPEEILNKPGRLTKEEYEIMKDHSIKGADIIDNLTAYKGEPIVKYSYEICRWHHERWDGRGYPDGLKGDEIPLSAQIVSIADVYDALTSVRCYKDAYSHEKSMEMIINGECGAFNPDLLKCFIEVGDDLRKKLDGKDGFEDIIDTKSAIRNLILEK